MVKKFLYLLDAIVALCGQLIKNRFNGKFKKSVKIKVDKNLALNSRSQIPFKTMDENGKKVR